MAQNYHSQSTVSLKVLQTRTHKMFCKQDPAPKQEASKIQTRTHKMFCKQDPAPKQEACKRDNPRKKFAQEI